MTQRCRDAEASPLTPAATFASASGSASSVSSLLCWLLVSQRADGWSVASFSASTPSLLCSSCLLAAGEAVSHVAGKVFHPWLSGGSRLSLTRVLSLSSRCRGAQRAAGSPCREQACSVPGAAKEGPPVAVCQQPS